MAKNNYELLKTTHFILVNINNLKSRYGVGL